jgi:hypothetical protein
MSLTITPVAVKQYGAIIYVVQYHACLEKPLTIEEMHLEPRFVPVPTEPGDNEFVQNLNNLNRSPIPSADLKDRRDSAFVKGDKDSSAPPGISRYLSQFKEPFDE